MALQALSEFAGLFFVPGSGSASVALALKMKNFTHQFSITEKNRLVLQSLELPPNLVPNNISFTGKGDGCALIQVKKRMAIAIFLIVSNNELMSYRDIVLLGSHNVFLWLV